MRKYNVFDKPTNDEILVEHLVLCKVHTLNRTDYDMRDRIGQWIPLKFESDKYFTKVCKMGKCHYVMGFYGAPFMKRDFPNYLILTHSNEYKDHSLKTYLDLLKKIYLFARLNNIEIEEESHDIYCDKIYPKICLKNSFGVMLNELDDPYTVYDTCRNHHPLVNRDFICKNKKGDHCVFFSDGFEKHLPYEILDEDKEKLIKDGHICCPIKCL